MDLGSRVSKLRKEKNLTQTELGKLVDVGKTTISNYETNYSTPDGDTLKKLANIFNTTTDYLLGNEHQIIDNSYNKKNDAEELGATLKEIFIKSGKIREGEEITAEMKEYVSELVKTALAQHFGDK